MALALVVQGHTDYELEKGEACMKLCVVYHAVGDKRVYEVVRRRPDLDVKAVEERILMDMFMYCWEHVDRKDLNELIKANSSEDVERFRNYLEFSVEKYMQPQVDLTIAREETELRRSSLNRGPRTRLADIEGTKEALRYAEQVRREKGL